MVRMFMREGEQEYTCIPGLNIVNQEIAGWQTRSDRLCYHRMFYVMGFGEQTPIGFEYM